MDENILKKQIGSKIKQLRAMKGWSRQQTADKLELSVTSYGSIERGETDVTLGRLAQLSEIFEITLFDLLGVVEKNVVSFSKTHNTECFIGGIHSSASNESHPNHEVRELQLIRQSQEKEIEYLKQQIAQLQEINQLLKQKSSDP
jgi:transcriptional regulator with XRE-family HTH domain